MSPFDFILVHGLALDMMREVVRVVVAVEELDCQVSRIADRMAVVANEVRPRCDLAEALFGWMREIGQ